MVLVDLTDVDFVKEIAPGFDTPIGRFINNPANGDSDLY